MASDQTSYAGVQVNYRLLVCGAALVGVGTMVALAGFALGGSALAVAARRAINAMDVPPTDLAKAKLSQAKVAAAAGVNAWQNGSAPHSAPVQ